MVVGKISFETEKLDAKYFSVHINAIQRAKPAFGKRSLSSNPWFISSTNGNLG